MTLLQRRRTRISEIDVALGLGRSDDDERTETRTYRDLPPGDRKARTEDLVRGRASDVERWSNRDNLLTSWSERAKIVAALITPPSRVLDLGCGKMDLEKFLESGVTYQPSDIVARDERTIVCDLNKGEVPNTQANVVTMLGVLEYIYEPAKLLEKLAARWPRLIATYCPADLDAGRDRTVHGWFNALTSAALVSTANAAGFDLTAIVPSTDRRDRVYVFDARRRTT